MGYSASMNMQLRINETSVVEGIDRKAGKTLSDSRNWTDGSGDTNVDVGSSDEHTLLASGSKDYTLSNGSMESILGGGNVTFDKIKAWEIKNTGSNPLEFSGNFLGISTQSIEIPAGGAMGLNYAAGREVVIASQDVLSVTSTLGTSYDFSIAGVGTIS